MHQPLRHDQIVLNAGGRLTGKRSANLLRVTSKLPASKTFLTNAPINVNPVRRGCGQIVGI